MSKVSSASVRAASQPLTGSLANVVGSVGVATDNANSTTGAVRLGSLVIVRLQGTYTSAAASSTGRPIFAVDVSMDAPDTAAASVSHWVPTYLIDASTFSSGRVDGYTDQFSPAPTQATGASAVAWSVGTPPWDTRGANWIRVRVADVDGTNPGALSLLTFGGESSP